MTTHNIWQKNERNTNCLEDDACPVMVWLGKLTALDMTSLGWLVRKTCFCCFFSIGPSMPELCLFLAHLSFAQDELLWSLFVRSPYVRPLTFSNDFSSVAAEPILLKFHMEPP